MLEREREREKERVNSGRSCVVKRKEKDDERRIHRGYAEEEIVELSTLKPRKDTGCTYNLTVDSTGVEFSTLKILNLKY